MEVTGRTRGQARPPTRPERTRETTGIERFQLGIVALGGRRFSSDGGTSSDNEVELDLLHLRLGTEGREAADFLFAGVLTLGQFSASDENTVRVRVRKTTGSGLRENLYAHSAGFGTGSRLTFVDTLAAFIHNNERSILPLRPSFAGQVPPTIARKRVGLRTVGQPPIPPSSSSCSRLSPVAPVP